MTNVSVDPARGLFEFVEVVVSEFGGVGDRAVVVVAVDDVCESFDEFDGAGVREAE